MASDAGAPEDWTLDELGSRACILATFGRHREAIELINTTLWRYPDDKRLYNNRCCSYIQNYDFENALADAVYLTENFPDFPKGYIRKGEVLALMKRYSEAEKEYRNALDLVDDEEIHIRYLQVQLLQIISFGFEPYSAWKALCETGSVQQSLRLLKTPFCNYEHVVNSSFYSDAYFKKIDDKSIHSEEEAIYGMESSDQLPELMEKLEVDQKGEGDKPGKEKENVVGGKKKKFPAKQDKSKKIVRRNKKKIMFLKSEERTENILTVRNKQVFIRKA